MEKIIEFTNSIAPFLSTIFTLLLLIVTSVYVILTWHILKVMKTKHEASLRPYVVPATFVVHVPLSPVTGSVHVYGAST